MEIGLLYFVVIVLANTVGAISGMGGGVIIRPIFDAIGYHDIVAISFYSSVAVFVMATVSSVRRLTSKVPFHKKMALLVSGGSIIGGIGGNVIFEWFLSLFQDDDVVLTIQIIVSIIVLLFSLFYARSSKMSFEMKSPIAYVLVGFLLGSIASFLGIGGGPINVAAFMLFFGVEIKDATAYSLVTIFFSQGARIVSQHFSTGFSIFDLRILWFIIPAAILGGLLGGFFNGMMKPKYVNYVFQMIVVVVIVLNAINGIALLQ